jgi:hypothetical protein
MLSLVESAAASYCVASERTLYSNFLAHQIFATVERERRESCDRTKSTKFAIADFHYPLGAVPYFGSSAFLVHPYQIHSRLKQVYKL